MIDIDGFFNAQLAAWPMAAANFAALADVCVKDAGHGMKVQFNPARIRSTGAKVDKASLAARPCFLCAANRPAEQIAIPWRDYEILVNPFPIFPRHLTIPALEHTPQRIAGRMADMAALARELPGYTVFYNGAHCGASAPDHFHFQAVPSEYLPIWQQLGDKATGDAVVFDSMHVLLPEYSDELFADESREEERMMNVLCRAEADGSVRVVVIPRRAHRPSFYGEGEGRMLVSPASVDLAGVFIVPVRKDYDAFTPDVTQAVISETCLSVDTATPSR